MAQSAKQSEEAYLVCQTRYWHIRLHNGESIVTHGRVGDKDVKLKKTKHKCPREAKQDFDRLVMKMKRKGYSVGEKPADSIDAEEPYTSKLEEPPQKRARAETKAERNVKLTRTGGQEVGMRLVAADERKAVGLRVAKIDPEGQAAKTKLVFAHDLVTHVNGTDVQQMSFVRAKKLMMVSDTFSLTLLGLRDKDGHRYDQGTSPSGPATCKSCKKVLSLVTKGLLDDWRCDSCGLDDLYATDPMFACPTLDKCDYGICIKCFEKHGGAGTSGTTSKPPKPLNLKLIMEDLHQEQSASGLETATNEPASSSKPAPVAHILGASATSESVVNPPSR